jgi:two-component system phosphate regulon response regulator PhoB
MDQSFPQPKIQSDGEPYIPPTHSKLILMVEDDDNLAKVYLMRFKAEGFDVKRVNNGEDALAAATQYHPDLILLDVMMPKISGFDVLDILRNTPETANIKVIMLTALGQETDRKKAENLGVDDYLVKSEVVLNDIIQDIKRVLSI